MLSSRLGFSLRTCAAAVLCAGMLRAESAGSVPMDDGSSNDVARPTADAVLVLVGEAAESVELRALLIEFLERQSAHARFVQQAEFQRRELLSSTTDSAVHVFVVPGSGLVRLYFRGPDGQRFLLREVKLQNGLDEVGRELIGQIVESSVDALLHSSAGITREQAQTELEQQALEPVVRPAARERSKQTPAASPPAKEARSGFEGWGALRYAAEWTGDPGLGHGPGLELGFGIRRGLLVRGRLYGERWFSQSIEGPAIGANILAQRGRLALDLGFGLGFGATIVLSVGAGADLVRVEPGRAKGPDFVPAGTSSNTVPAARGEVRVEAGGDEWQFAVGFSADASLADTHYDVADVATVQRVAEEWAVRPGAGIAIGWRPNF